MNKKLSILEKKVLADLLRHMMNEKMQDARLGRLSLLNPDFYAEITQSIAEKLELPLSEYFPAVDGRCEEVDNG